MNQLPYIMIISIVLIGSWIDYRKKVKKAENEEAMRRAFVPFLLVVVLFLVSISLVLI